MFQNAQYFDNHFTHYLGEGVFAASTEDNIALDNFRVAVGYDGANSFYNMYTAVDMEDYLVANISNNNCYSTAASYTTGAAPNQPGQQGFSLYTDRWHKLTVNQNNLYNIAASIIFTADVGDYYNGSGVSTGRYAGQVDFTNNLIRPHTIGNTPTTQFVNLGIDAEDLLTDPNDYTNTIESGTNINIANNTIDKVWNGIYVADFGLQGVNTYSNYVTTVKALNEVASPTNQFGINVVGVNTATISVNNVETNISSTELNRNITTASNGTVGVGCNTVVGGYRGIECNGTQLFKSLALTTFSNNAEGLALDNSGVIGQQGSATNPEDNQWMGTWGTSNTSSPYKTYTAGGSSAQNSKIYVRTTPTYSPTCDPDGNGGASDGVYGSPTVVGDNYYHTGLMATLPSYTLTHALYTCSATPVPTCSGCRTAAGGQTGLSPEDSSDAANVLDLKERVVGNVIQYDPADSSLQRYLSKMVIYRALRGDTSNFQGSAKLRKFYNDMQSSNTEKLFKIEDALLKGNYSRAQSHIATVANANDVENNYLSYYSILIKYKKGLMDASDSSNLSSLAWACPFTAGNVVYQARTLYNMVNSPRIVFTNNCGNNNQSRLAFKNANEGGVTTTFDANVYPNPNLGKEVFISTVNFTKGTVAIRITDLEGRVILENNYTVENSLSNIRMAEIKNGVYFVHITNTTTGEKVVKKIVIQY